MLARDMNSMIKRLGREHHDPQGAGNKHISRGFHSPHGAGYNRHVAQNWEPAPFGREELCPSQ